MSIFLFTADSLKCLQSYWLMSSLNRYKHCKHTHVCLGSVKGISKSTAKLKQTTTTTTTIKQQVTHELIQSKSQSTCTLQLISHYFIEYSRCYETTAKYGMIFQIMPQNKVVLFLQADQSLV